MLLVSAAREDESCSRRGGRRRRTSATPASRSEGAGRTSTCRRVYTDGPRSTSWSCALLELAASRLGDSLPQRDVGSDQTPRSPRRPRWRKNAPASTIARAAGGSQRADKHHQLLEPVQPLRPRDRRVCGRGRRQDEESRVGASVRSCTPSCGALRTRRGRPPSRRTRATPAEARARVARAAPRCRRSRRRGGPTSPASCGGRRSSRRPRSRARRTARPARAAAA